MSRVPAGVPVHSPVGPATVPVKARRPGPAGLGGPVGLVWLQRAAGNRAVSGLLRPAPTGQPPRSTPTVQRKMGLEFETGVAVRTEKGQTLGYNAPVFLSRSDKGWVVKADSSNLEFVTTELVSLSHRVKVMDDLIEFVKDLDGRLQKSSAVTVGELPGGDKETGRQGYRIQGNGSPIAALPQATFGVPLDKMLSMLKAAKATPIGVYSTTGLGGGQEQTAVTLSGAEKTRGMTDATVLADRYNTKLQLLHQSPSGTQQTEMDRATGLAALVFSHLNDFWRDRNNMAKAPYAKSLLSILHRTDFHSMYASLDNFGKSCLTPELIADVWWESNDPPAQKLVTMSKYTTHQSGFPDRGEPHQGYRLDEWLASITDPASLQVGSKRDARYWDRKDGRNERSRKDLMSRGAPAYNSTSLGAMEMDSTDPNFGHQPLAVIEFRELANSPPLPWYLWSGFASQMHRLYGQTTGVRLKKN